MVLCFLFCFVFDDYRNVGMGEMEVVTASSDY